MSRAEDFGAELVDFVRRVAELRSARSVPAADLATVLDAALFELGHAVDRLWPAYEDLVNGGRRSGPPADREEQRLLRAIFRRLPLPVALVDRETALRRMNPAAADLTGIRAGFATGRPLTGILRHADRVAFRSQTAAVARGDGDRSVVVHLQHSPGLPVRATLTALRPGADSRTAVLVVLQPSVTGEQRPLPAPDLGEATRHAAEVDLADALTTALLTAPAGDRRAVVEQAAAVLHGRLADWVIVDDGAARPYRTTVLGPPGAPVAEVAAQDPAACPLVVEAARGGVPALQVRPEDPDAFGRDATGAPVLVRAEVTSLLCVPLSVGTEGPVEGVLTLFRRGARPPFSLAEARAVDVLSRHLALALRRGPRTG
ncbi:PAS domain-containing protein [Streptomyces alfalfae]|uniref:PAS domain-containing protein n=1 Tax=Streptomyces alfalfae TaxID=1642299 RepID=UPI002811E021|nr:PAS domain-containing protein [Streptomyces alfalfae]